MEPNIEIESAHGDEGYEAPDVERLGTAEALTAGVSGGQATDQVSVIG